METERSFTEGVASLQQAPEIGERTIVNSMIASNAIDKRTMADRAIGVHELDLDPAEVATGELLAVSIVSGNLVLQSLPAAELVGVIPAAASVTQDKINTGTDAPADGEFLQYTAAGLRWSAIPRQTDITAAELASGVIPTALPPTDDSVTPGSIRIVTGVPQAGDALLYEVSGFYWGRAPIDSDSLPETALEIHNEPAAGKVLGYTTNGLEWVDDQDTTYTIPTNLPPTAASVLPAMINAGGTAEAGKILKLTSALAWAWADDNSSAGSGGVPNNESVTEAKLDAHNNPTDGYALKWSTQNGLYWGEDTDTTYTIPTELPPTDASVTPAKLSISGTASAGKIIRLASATTFEYAEDQTGFSVSGTPSAGQVVKYGDSGPEWGADADTTYTNLPPTDGSVTDAKVASDAAIAQSKLADIAVNDLPTIPYSKLSSTPTIPTSLPPTDASVTPAKISATDTPTTGEFLQISIDAQGNETFNWSTAVTTIADSSITEPKLAAHNTPTDDQVLAWDATNSRLYWKDDQDTTYTIPTELPPTDASVTEAKLAAHNTPTDDQVLAWDATNSRLYWKDDAQGSGGGGLAIGGTQADGRTIVATSSSAQRWENLSPGDLNVSGTPAEGQTIVRAGSGYSWGTPGLVVATQSVSYSNGSSRVLNRSYQTMGTPNATHFLPQFPSYITKWTQFKSFTIQARGGDAVTRTWADAFAYQSGAFGVSYVSGDSGGIIDGISLTDPTIGRVSLISHNGRTAAVTFEYYINEIPIFESAAGQRGNGSTWVTGSLTSGQSFNSYRALSFVWGSYNSSTNDIETQQFPRRAAEDNTCGGVIPIGGTSVAYQFEATSSTAFRFRYPSNSYGLKQIIGIV